MDKIYKYLIKYTSSTAGNHSEIPVVQKQKEKTQERPGGFVPTLSAESALLNDSKKRERVRNFRELSENFLGIFIEILLKVSVGKAVAGEI